MISTTGYWIGTLEDKHMFDPHLSEALLGMFKGRNKRIIDFGCGLGRYVNLLNYKGLNIKGYDGNPDTRRIAGPLCRTLDLTGDISIEADWILSLEVGEHIPKEYESKFIDNLHNSNKEGIILSWAIPGQAGYGHVNCRDNDYIKGIFTELGYTNDLLKEQKLRNSATLPWFKETIMVFTK